MSYKPGDTIVIRGATYTLTNSSATLINETIGLRFLPRDLTVSIIPWNADYTNQVQLPLTDVLKALSDT